MTDAAGLPIQTYQPATFKERGLSVPFTTPMLAGARVRAGGEAAGVGRPARTIELVVPNPSGGRGVYVVGWQRVGDLCRPTLHDSRLGTALETHHRLHGELVPAEVRRLTRNVVLEGFAGRAAAQAARVAAAAATQLVADTNRRLLARLAESDGAGPHCGEPGADDPRVRRALAAVAVEARQDVDGVAGAVERLAHLVAELGLDATDRGGAVARTLLAMDGLSAAIGRRAQNAAAADARGAGFIVANAELTVSLARRAADMARLRIAAVPRSLGEWIARPAGFTEAVGRVEWLLDGWHRLCLLWSAAPPGSPPAAIVAEMAALIPPMPPQADDWLGLPPGTATQANPTQQGSRGTMPQEGRGMDIVARNEHLLALAA